MTSADIIILSWDRLDDTIAAITSALEQQSIELRVIVVDQGSKPENLQKLKEFCAKDSRVLLLCNTINNGVPGGRNQASFAGNGTYIVALDNDAVFADQFQLAKSVEIMNSHPNLGILAFRIKLFSADIDDISSWAYSDDPTDEPTQIFKTTRFVGAGHSIRRDIFEKIGGYDERLFFMHEEVDLSKRMINAGYEIEYNPNVVVRHKVSPENRVGWTDKRFYYDVRNRTYLHIKHKTKILTMAFHTFLLLSKGLRMGYFIPALKGLASAIILIPSAIHQRLKDPYLSVNEWAEKYNNMCNPLANRSLWERIKFRISNYKK